jgi:tetratricopeptide (TPR) repeat protein
MRARAGLAEALWEVGRKAEALEHMWELLRLNPHDNQGIRDALLPRLLAQHDHASAHRLIDMFDDDGTAIFAYGRALLAYAEEGATATANGALDSALSTNEFVPPYLLGRRRVPRKLPESMGFGDEDEGVICAAHHLAAWASVEGATIWLGDRWPGPAGSPVHRSAVTAVRVRPSGKQRG